MTYLLFGLLLGQCWALCYTNSVFMAVMYTVLLFTNASALLLQLGYQFMAVINVLIYVGALAVLFLFVVMLIHVPATTLYSYYTGIGVLSLLGAFGTRLAVGGFTGVSVESTDTVLPFPSPLWGEGDGASLDMYTAVFAQESLSHIGQAFYVHYGDILVLNSLVLTVALFGALTIAHTRA